MKRALAAEFADHPRSRGVYPRPQRPQRSCPGSSPLARGLPAASPVRAAAAGIIPARAGFTRPSLLELDRLRDHPRSRGVYNDRWQASWNAAGSSPLARGLRPAVHRPVRPPRIIPARAGFTESNPRCDHPGWDHPRSRGVYCGSAHPDGLAPGSSPLARGLQKLILKIEMSIRIIPARAGFTPLTEHGRRPTGDHPRSRGVYYMRESWLAK